MFQNDFDFMSFVVAAVLALDVVAVRPVPDTHCWGYGP